MVTLGDALSVLRPNAVPLVDYTIVNNGSGDVIASWSYVTPQPTPSEIAAVTQAQVDAARRAKAVNAAVAVTFTGLEASQISDRVTLRYVFTCLNDVREHVGLPRILEADHITGLMAAVALGAGDPVTP